MKTTTLAQRAQAPAPSRRPLLVFDGDCHFCRHWIARWQQSTGDRVDYRSLQEAAAAFPEIPRAQFESAVQLIEPNGRVLSGADAVLRLFDFSTSAFGLLLSLLVQVPGFMATARKAYGVVARHRSFFSKLSVALFGRTPARPSYLVARWIFPRVLGLVYLVAFVSLAVQIRGLIGERGILSARQLLDTVGPRLGGTKFLTLPTVFWWNASDTALVGSCWAGAGISALLIAGVWPGACLFLTWLLYLSISVVGSTFLGYQWDAFLLEAGFLTLFLCPPFALKPVWNLESTPARIGRWLLLWLAFRITFESGVVKLASLDPAWRNLTALTFHYGTQPLPLWTAWYAAQLPLWIQKSACAGMFAIELLAPFLIFGPRNARRVGAAAMIALQMGIAATGNYNFFNLLSASLYLLLLDDAAWPAALRRHLSGPAAPRGPWQNRIHGALLLPVATLHTLVATTPLIGMLWPKFENWPQPVVWLHETLAPFRSANRYGLFAVMTTKRPEILMEGSDNGVIWRAYEFPWKPGDPYERPRLCEPHQPRLDWQMWFAALEAPHVASWLYNFGARLLEGSPEVLALLKSNPFPDKPPRYIRATLYEYRFTRSGENNHAWWAREFQGVLMEPIALRSAGADNAAGR